ncbi:Hypp1469 [Branchiostoma lanceolatum]|uniref:Protein LTV1 homolog n=2 Tax=Branchiostoma lanceolatum TaxID=7740 RepID=A0A8K0EJ13_BRALA|nr:Hypp1469 [Branchiostoma lanceolatum]
MPRKKKKFIDNKSAVTFHLVHRSQRDPLLADEDKPQHVLQQVSASTEKRREEQRKFGVYFEDEYDYLQHLKEPGQAVLEPTVSRVRIKKAEVTDEPQPEETPKLQLPASVFPSEQEEDVGMLNKAAPLVGPQLDWDPDIVAALDEDFNYDDPNNALEDDFIAMATAAPTGEEEEVDSDGEYPSDECEMESDEEGSSEGMTYRTTKSRFTEYSITSSVMRRNDGLTLLDDRFEKLYEEYDDDEMGPLDHEELTGTVQQDSLVLNSILQEYEKKKEESIIRRLDPEREGMEEEGDEDEEVSSESESEEDDLVRVVTEQPKEKWDCESILSTYSSIYNHPTVIKDPPKPKKGKQIILSQKSGIPIGVLSSKGVTKKQLEELDRMDEEEEGSSEEEDEEEGERRSAPARRKGETPEEKKQRKQAVKAERRERRMEKKANKLAFKEEVSRQEKVVMNQRNLKGIKLA